jgi:hypothetical protein
MTIKDSDRRKAFWISFVYILSAPIQVKLGLDAEAVKASAYAVTTLGIANYFTKPQGD